jgi:hypothetical protein
MTNITDTIQMYSIEMKSPYNDGWNSFAQKQKLLKISWAVEKALQNAPTFVGEDEWLAENMPQWKKEQLASVE